MSSTYDYSSSDSDLSTTSSSLRYNMDSTPIIAVEVLRCMRCAREVETTSTDDVTATGMVQIAQNLYYCSRCAKATGYQ